MKQPKVLSASECKCDVCGADTYMACGACHEEEAKQIATANSERDRRAALYPELVAALESFVTINNFVNPKTHDRENDAAVLRAVDVLAKCKQTP